MATFENVDHQQSAAAMGTVDDCPLAMASRLARDREIKLERKDQHNILCTMRALPWHLEMRGRQVVLPGPMTYLALARPTMGTECKRIAGMFLQHPHAPSAEEQNDHDVRSMNSRPYRYMTS